MSHYVYKYVYNNVIIYIGKTDTSLIRRLNEHGKNGDNIDDKYWDKINNSDIYYCYANNRTMSDVIESELIRRYKPICNKAKKSDWSGIEFVEPKWIYFDKNMIENEIKEQKTSNKEKGQDLFKKEWSMKQKLIDEKYKFDRKIMEMEREIKSLKVYKKMYKEMIEEKRRKDALKEVYDYGVKYHVTDLYDTRITCVDSKEFLKKHNTYKIKEQIIKIIKCEAPIARNVLCKRICRAWGIVRKGIEINTRIEEIISDLKLEQTNSYKDIFYWNVGQKSSSYTSFRVPIDDESKRTLDEIAPQEIANAINYLLQRQVSMSLTDIEKEIGSLFGFSRNNKAIQMGVAAGLEEAIDREYAVREGDRILIKRKVMENNLEKIKFYEQDDKGELKRVNKCMIELT